jgi:hypothetical protein
MLSSYRSFKEDSAFHVRVEKFLTAQERKTTNIYMHDTIFCCVGVSCPSPRPNLGHAYHPREYLPEPFSKKADHSSV